MSEHQVLIQYKQRPTMVPSPVRDEGCKMEKENSKLDERQDEGQKNREESHSMSHEKK